MKNYGAYDYYKIYDCFGAPQCGIEETICEEWAEVDAYFEDPAAAERLAEGYAWIQGFWK